MKGWMRKAAEWLYHILLKHQLLRTDETRGLISGIQGGNLRQTERLVEDYYIRLIQEIMIILLFVILLGGAIGIRELLSDHTTIHIVRSDYGEDAEYLTLYYEDSEHQRQPIELEVLPVQYREEELERVFDQGFAYLEEMMSVHNDLSYVTEDLQLETEIPGSGLTVNWVSDDYEYLSDDGRIHNEELDSPVVVNLTAELTYNEEVRTKVYSVHIAPPEYSSETAEQKKAAEYLEQVLQSYNYDKEIDLPADQKEFHYYEAAQDHTDLLMIVMIGVVLIIFRIAHHKSRLKEQREQRKRMLQSEYSNFINQILLYLSSGNTAQGSVIRIITQYEKHKKTDHPLYQELLLFKHEIQTGVAQEQALIHFARRTGVLSYIKAMALLSQQIKKGGHGMVEQLEQEEHEAFEQRKELAKKSGEEAGTKLLFPMILLMIVSMILVMYPAFASFTYGF